jgi:hypothetical protein
VIPRQFSDDQDTSKLLNKVRADLPEAQFVVLENFVDLGGRAFQGAAFYPRYNRSYESGSVWDVYQPRSFDHVDFYLSSPNDTGVVLPFSKRPDNFPHASNVIVFGCRRGRTLDAMAAVIYSSAGDFNKILLRYPMPDDLTCPFPAVE